MEVFSDVCTPASGSRARSAVTRHLRGRLLPYSMSSRRPHRSRCSRAGSDADTPLTSSSRHPPSFIVRSHEHSRAIKSAFREL